MCRYHGAVVWAIPNWEQGDGVCDNYDPSPGLPLTMYHGGLGAYLVFLPQTLEVVTSRGVGKGGSGGRRTPFFEVQILYISYIKCPISAKRTFLKSSIQNNSPLKKSFLRP